MATYDIVEGTTDALQFQLIENGVPINLNGLTINLILNDRNGNTVTSPGTITTVDPTNGKIQLVPSSRPAITRDSSAKSAYTTTTGTVSWNHTNNGNLLLVFLNILSGSPATVHYGNVPLGLLPVTPYNVQGDAQVGPTNFWPALYAYYLVNPPTGTNAIQIASNPLVPAGGTVPPVLGFAGTSVSYTNVDLSEFPRDFEDGGQAYASGTNSVATSLKLHQNSWSTLFVGGGTASAPVGGLNVTSVQTDAGGGGTALFDSNSGESAGTFVQTATGSGLIGAVAVEIPTDSSVFMAELGPYYARWSLTTTLGNVSYVPTSVRDVWNIIGN